MALSIFDDKSHQPTPEDLEEALGASYDLWKQIVAFVHRNYPAAIEEWKHPGKNWGWGFRLKDKRRVIIYQTPGNGFFRVAMVFGEKATQQVLSSEVSGNLKELLESAAVYAEGRGIRWEVKTPDQLKDIETLILIKISN